MTIELVELIGTTRYIVSVNNTNIKINIWKGGFNSLKQFIQECEQALLTKDAQLIRRLLVKYGLNAPSTFCTLSEFVFYEQFMVCFNAYGESFMKEGEPFSANKFCNLIHPTGSKNLIKSFRSLFNEAEKCFEYKCALVNLKQAFNQRLIQKVHKIYKTLQVSRFYNIVNQLNDEFKSYLHFCATNLFQNGQHVSYTGLYKYAISSSTIISFDNLNKELSEAFMNVLTKSHQENKQVRIKLGQPFWVIPYRDVQLNRFRTFNFIDIALVLKDEIQLYLLNWHKKGESAKALSRRFSNIKKIVVALQEVSPDCLSFLDVTYVEALQVFDVLSQARTNKNLKKFKLKTIQSSISEARLLFDWLKDTNLQEGLNNPFRRLKLHNINAFVESALFIPEEVVEQISEVIHECPPMYNEYG